MSNVMRKIILSVLLPTLLPLGALAQDFEVDGLLYNKTSDTTVEVTTRSTSETTRSIYEGDIVVPETITADGKDYQVTGVGERAFSSSEVTSVALPNCVKYIAGMAFSGAGIKEIKLPAQLEKIDEMAFSACKLESVALPEGLLSIGYQAFGGTPLKEVVIPSTVKEMGVSPFYYCGYSYKDYKSYGLATLKVAEGNPYFDSRNDCNAIIETATGKLIQATATTMIPEDVETIGSCAFAGLRGMETLYLPASVKTLEMHCLDGCLDLTDLYMACQEVPANKGPLCELDGLRFDKIVVHVPTGCKDMYAANATWSLMKDIVEFDPAQGNPTAIAAPAAGVKDAQQRFAIDGKQTHATRRGIAIVRQKDGSTRKILVR